MAKSPLPSRRGIEEGVEAVGESAGAGPEVSGASIEAAEPSSAGRGEGRREEKEARKRRQEEGGGGRVAMTQLVGGESPTSSLPGNSCCRLTAAWSRLHTLRRPTYNLPATYAPLPHPLHFLPPQIPKSWMGLKRLPCS
jgi:hypothetical protein